MYVPPSATKNPSVRCARRNLHPSLPHPLWVPARWPQPVEQHCSSSSLHKAESTRGRGGHTLRQGRGQNRASCMNLFYSGHREAGAPKRPVLTPCLALPCDTAPEQLLRLVFLLQNWDREWKFLCQLPTANRPGRPANWSVAKAFLLSHRNCASRAWTPFSDSPTFGASLLVKWECRGEEGGTLAAK